MDKARKGDWTVAEDGSLYTLPIGSNEVRIGQVDGQASRGMEAVSGSRRLLGYVGLGSLSIS